MKRWLGTAAVLAAFCLVPAEVRAQEEPGASRISFGGLAGASWSSPWATSGEGTRLGIGFNPALGAIGNFWLTPRFGAHLHFSYLPSDPPQPDGDYPLPVPEGRLHNLAYDLSLAYRPFAERDGGGVMQSFYLFLGGGAFTVHVTGDVEGVRCIPGYTLGNACLPYDWRAATVPQLTTGFGIELLPITRRLGMFVEGGLHAYRSPFRFGEEWTGVAPCPNPACQLEGTGAVSLRLGTGIAVTLGTFDAPALPLPPPPPPAPIVREEREITVCVVAEGTPRRVEARIRLPEGDTVLVTAQEIRRPLRAVHPVPPITATGREWFERDEHVFLDGRRYQRTGGAVDIEPGTIARVGEHQGVPLFVARGAPAPPPTLYVPVRDGCSFQSYQLQDRGRR
jgi:hypothetical protein